jgi:putative ABC transport system permease protein
MYSLAAILIGLIMFGSISLIYNAFSISVSDRIREFGLLSSIGATKRQLRKMVFMEAVYVSGIGIPIGILSGIVGMGITFFFLGNKMSYIVGIDKVQFHLSFSLPVLLVACLLSFLTVLLSAWLPSKRANKATAMDCIRQTEEVRVRAKEVKTPKLVYRLFGLEGMLGDKNFKRSRRRYRVTVASLFMSIVLFISASSFCTYLTDSVKDVFTYNDYDIMMQWQTATDGTKIDLTDTIASLKDTVGITGYSGMKRTYREGRLTDNTLLDKTVRLYGLTEETYQAYLKQVGLSLADYENEEAPLAIAMVENGTFNPETGRLEKQTVLDKSVRELLLINDTDDTEDTEEEEEQEILVKIGAYVDELPLGMNTEYVASGIYLFYPLKIYEGLFTENSENIIYFKTETPEATYQSFLRTAEEKGYSENWFYTIYEEMKRAKYLVMVIQTFSYGFITLITLISLANVFNTISTNVLLRRKEFAVLRSVGMTARGLRKILSYECILYGVKSLVLGIPVAFGVTYLIYRSIKEGYDTAFYLPIPAVGIAVGSVFLVVFAAMFYGMRKVKGDIIFSEID